MFLNYACRGVNLSTTKHSYGSILCSVTVLMFWEKFTMLNSLENIWFHSWAVSQ